MVDRINFFTSHYNYLTNILITSTWQLIVIDNSTKLTKTLFIIHSIDKDIAMRLWLLVGIFLL